MCPYLTFPPQIGPIRVGEHCPFEAGTDINTCGFLVSASLTWSPWFTTNMHEKLRIQSLSDEGLSKLSTSTLAIMNTRVPVHSYFPHRHLSFGGAARTCSIACPFVRGIIFPSFLQSLTRPCKTISRQVGVCKQLIIRR